MTVNECIQRVDAIEPNDYTSEQKARWVWECEGKLWSQVFLMQAGEFRPEEGTDATLSLPVPYDRVYPLYLQAMIHYANGEYDRYANSMAVFNGAWGEVHRWIGGSFDVSNLWRNQRVTAELDPTAGDQTILTIPEGCALAGVRLAVTAPFTRQYPTLVLTEIMYPAVYCVEIGGSWSHFEPVTALPAGTRFWISGTSLYYQVPREQPQTTLLVSGKEGTPLDFSIRAQLWLTDPTQPVGMPAALDARGSTPEPMLLADIGGTELGVTLGPGSWDTDGKLVLSARMLVSDEAALWRK